MALLERPSAMSASTSCSRAVTAGLGAGVAGGVQHPGDEFWVERGVAGCGADLMPAVGEDLGQARPDHGGVLGEDDTHPGLPSGVRRQVHGLQARAQRPRSPHYPSWLANRGIRTRPSRRHSWTVLTHRTERND
jgi:hypothetical protein